jgi:hypothetical protein
VIKVETEGKRQEFMVLKEHQKRERDYIRDKTRRSTKGIRKGRTST